MTDLPPLPPQIAEIMRMYREAQEHVIEQMRLRAIEVEKRYLAQLSGEDTITLPLGPDDDD